MSYRIAAGGQYNCPRCLQSLTASRAGAFLVDACTACGGLFIDNGATQELVRAFDRDLVAFATTLGVGKGQAVGPGLIRGELACPKCTGPLARVDLPSAQLAIDVCAEHGTWFDANELPKVARAYKRRREGAVADMADDDLAKVLTGAFRP
jgi:Zn-finger nucleic acid-binding protein